MKAHTIRLVVGAGIGVVVMLVLLKLAILYLERDWNQKTRRAGAAKPAKAAPAETATVAAPAEPAGREYTWADRAAPRFLRRMAADRVIPNNWLILSRGLAEKSDAALQIPALFMAMSVAGENAKIHNDLGAAYLQQKNLKQAREHFAAADQIQPGFAPARFNLALCAITERSPARASQLLGQYLGQRPGDIAALRLQTTLLSQLGAQRTALNMIEKFLRDQPPEQPLFLEAAILAARLGQPDTALRYLETAMNGNPIQTVIRAYQSPAFRDIRLSGNGDILAGRMAEKARTAFSTPIPPAEIQPRRAAPAEIKVR